MAVLPSASVKVQDQSAAAPISTDLCAVFFPCTTNADNVPRLWSSVAAMIATHGDCEGAEYAALHMQDTKKPILGVPLPINTYGSVGRFNTGGNTGTSVASIAATSSNSIVAETDGVLQVVTGTNVGTDQIVLSLSLDGGSTYKTVRLGSNQTLVIPHTGMTLSFTLGTLNAGDTILTWHSTAPTADLTALSTAISTGSALGNMAAQNLTTRSWIFIGDVQSTTQGQGVETAINAYETQYQRFSYAKFQARDRHNTAKCSTIQSRAYLPSPQTITFSASVHTITRSAGSFTTDGFQAGDTVRVSGATAGGDNGNLGVPSSITATILTFASGLVTEGPDASGQISITSEPTLTFTTTTITRNRGSWLDDGFAVGDTPIIAGTTTNDGSLGGAITALTATVMTFAGGLTAQTIGTQGVSITVAETDSAWQAAVSATFSAISSSYKVDIGAGRGRRLSPVTGYNMRRPVQWADSIRSYQNDVRTTTWWKKLGALTGWNIAGEHDERINQGLLGNRFTCFRTWGNGPQGAFIAQSVTRYTDSSPLALTHNVACVQVGQTSCQIITENFAGQTIPLQPPNSANQRFATPAALAALKADVDQGQLQNVLSNIGGQGARASQAYWTPATNDDLSVANATLNGTLTFKVNGVLVTIATVVGVS